MKNNSVKLTKPILTYYVDYTDINKKWYFDLELDLLKKLQEQENQNDKTN